MDDLFKALNDPARRVLLDRLRARDGQTLTELEAALPGMTRFGVMKHLRVLEAAGLVTARKAGRFRHHYLNPVPLIEALDRWIEPFRLRPAAEALIALKSTLETPMDAKPAHVLRTYIRCTPESLWAALTAPEGYAAFNALCAGARGRLAAPGDRLDLLDPAGGVMLSHRVTAADPPRRLEITFEPAWAGPGMAASRCRYLIDPAGPDCRLTVEHFDLPAGQEGIEGGWVRMLSGLKTWIETGAPARFAIAEAEA